MLYECESCSELWDTPGTTCPYCAGHGERVVAVVGVSAEDHARYAAALVTIAGMAPSIFAYSAVALAQSALNPDGEWR